jgi:uroporphyrinogen-III synthase
MKPRIPTSTDALKGWTLVCLRERAQQPAAARLIAKFGAQALALPGLKLERLPAQDRLRAALTARAVAPAAAVASAAAVAVAAVFVSPAAVRFALALCPALPKQLFYAAAVGAGTARALQRAGFARVLQPAAGLPQTSEGLLAHPQLQQGNGQTLLLIGAPGGRGLLSPALAARGFRLCRVDVYRRARVRLDTRHFHALEAASAPLGLLMTSAEAFDAVLDQVPPALFAKLLSARLVASSERLIEHAHERGFGDGVLAQGPALAQLVEALAVVCAASRC